MTDATSSWYGPDSTESVPLLTMCEIAITHNPMESDDDEGVSNIKGLVDTASVLYSDNPDGLGVVAIYDDGDSFSFDTYKSPEPDFSQDSPLYGWFAANLEAWRFVIHARLATAGGVNYAATHPILTRGCPGCEWDYVVHNGSVRNYESHMTQLHGDGHEFTTTVDSEVIAHKMSLPDSLDEDEFDGKPEDLKGSLNFLLFSEDGILMRTTQKYRVTEGFEMACTRKRDWLSYGDGTKKRGYHLVTPGASSDSYESGGISFRQVEIDRGRGSYAGWAGRGAYAGVAGRGRAARSAGGSGAWVFDDERGEYVHIDEWRQGEDEQDEDGERQFVWKHDDGDSESAGRYGSGRVRGDGAPDDRRGPSPSAEAKRLAGATGVDLRRVDLSSRAADPDKSVCRLHGEYEQYYCDKCWNRMAGYEQQSAMPAPVEWCHDHGTGHLPGECPYCVEEMRGRQRAD